MEVVETVAALRAARARFPAIGLVPTMGYLHAGHISLVERAKAECGAAAVSIFVNPTQFGANEDLGRYPRDLPRDLELLAAAGADIAFTPQPPELYPTGFQTSIELGPVTEPLEGTVRPGHFAGVATIVAKLFNIVQPKRAYFGQKDAQQSVVVRRMARDLDFPVEIVVAPTVREADGLAMSSRNAYLTAEERQEATLLYRALVSGEALFREGERNAATVRAAIRERIEINPHFTLDYVSIADADTLEELATIDRDAFVSLAARLGTTRLLDNVLLRI